jgi:hypothetical protein
MSSEIEDDHERWIGKNMEGGGRYISENIVSGFTCKNWGKNHKNLSQNTQYLTQIRTMYLPNTSLEIYRSVKQNAPWMIFLYMTNHVLNEPTRDFKSWHAIEAENLRILPGPVRGPFGPTQPESEVIFKYVTRTPPEPDFLLFQPEWSPIYLQSALTILLLIHVSFNA